MDIHEPSDSFYGSTEVATKKEGNSAELTAGLIIADVVGAGILSMAVAVARMGWLLGAAMMMILLAMNVHISLLMWRVRMHFPGTRSYVELATAAFSRTSEGQQKTVALVSGSTQYVFIFCMLGLYALSSGRGLGNMLYDRKVCLPTWTLIACAMILPFHTTARRLGTWQSLVWINVATIVGTCAIPLVFMAWQGVAETRAPGSAVYAVTDFSFAGTFGAMSTFTFAFTSQFMIAEIISEMRDPGEFPKAYVQMAAPFQAVAFLTVGLGGYYFMGDSVYGMIGDNIPFGSVFRVAAFCLVAHMLVTYMIKGIVICRALHWVLDEAADNDESYKSWGQWTSVVTITLVLSWLIACIVPFFSDLVDFIGASFTPICCYIIPIAMYVRWSRDFREADDQPSKLEWLIISVELLTAVLLCFIGTFFSVKSIIDKWDVYGPPFACHCQQMWNTCNCSASHAGMREQCGNLAFLPVEPEVELMVDSHFVR